jgi:hypothetical protein
MSKYTSYIYSEDLNKVKVFAQENLIRIDHIYTLQSMPYTKISLELTEDQLTFLKLSLGPESLFWIEDE